MFPLSFRAEVGNVNVDARTVDIIFSTGAAVPRYDYRTGTRYREVLSMDPKHVRLDRLNSVGAVLDTHSAWSVSDVFGAVESAQIKSGRGLATLRFSRRDDVTPVWQDVQDGILRSFSVGYNVYTYAVEPGTNGEMETRTAIDWEPFEISVVPMPADAGATVRSGQASGLAHPCILQLPPNDGDRIRRFLLAQARSRA